jgi:glycosyltransferase involved in cell wall biosynthesis
VAENAASYFNPDSASELSSLMLEMLNSENLKNEIRLKGRKRLESFAWQKAAAATAKVYREIS